eukprot:COSAG06_NODE_654_length_13350_cov_72.384499_6_plen_124_part_00
MLKNRIDHLLRSHSRGQSEIRNQIYSLGQYTVIPVATYGFAPPGCRRGRLAAAFPRPRVSGRLAPASAWAVWPGHSRRQTLSESVYTHLVTKTWLPDALLRSCPSPRARSARGAGCPTPSCGR